MGKIWPSVELKLIPVCKNTDEKNTDEFSNSKDDLGNTTKLGMEK